jgi:hypothetical protein
MHLHEEYIRRHNLHVPVILYRQRSTVFLRSKNTPYFWRILSFHWHDPDRHPGFWDVTYNEIIRNGPEINRFVHSIDKVDSCFSDQYEETVLEFVNRVRSSHFVAIPNEERVLAAWQILLTMYDYWLASHKDKEFFDLVANSLDSTKSISDRLLAYQQAKDKLSDSKPVLDTFIYNLVPLTRGDSAWLIGLINE